MKDIDPMYCCNTDRFNLSEETRLCRSADDVKEKTFPVTKKFITEIFFMCHYGLHIGVLPIFSTYDRILQELSRLQQKKKELSSISSPMNDLTMKKLQVMPLDVTYINIVGSI
jgi:hypothetical protein